MKVTDALEALVANVVLLLALYFVLGDEAQRAAYAARLGLSYSFSRSFLVQVSVLQGSRGVLQSPLSIDWVQILAAGLILVDALVVYGLYAGKRVARTRAA